jgi:hypothetical protein
LEYTGKGIKVFKLLSTIYAIPFYLSLGYKKSTGVRRIHSFEGEGLYSQPMKKLIHRMNDESIIN